jgi:hypothetical protein
MSTDSPDNSDAEIYYPGTEGGVAIGDQVPLFQEGGVGTLDAWAPTFSDAGTCAVAQGENADGGCDVSQVCLANQCISKGTLLPQAVDGSGLAACTNPPCMNVFNNCTIPLWTHVVGSMPVDNGNVRELQPGAQYQYAGVPLFGGGRMYAYYQQPPVMQGTRPISFYNGYVEMTVGQRNGQFVQNYDISYVDSVSLPDCITHDPDGGTYDQTKPYCSKMQAAHGYKGSSVYGGIFLPQMPSQNVAWWDGVAGWNRGTTAGDTTYADYYAAEPYNDYAKMIHVDMGCRATPTIEGVYAFSTDDHQNQSGFVQCVSPVLNVVWCPYQ